MCSLIRECGETRRGSLQRGVGKKAGEAQQFDGDEDDDERVRVISPDSLAFYRVSGVVAMLLMVDNGGELLDSVGGYSSLSVRTVRLLYWLYVYSYCLGYST